MSEGEPSIFKIVVDADIKHLIPVFLEDMSESCRAVEAALRTGNFETIAESAHRIKGTGGVFGVHELSRLGAELETSALARDLSRISDISGRISAYLNEIEIEFK